MSHFLGPAICFLLFKAIERGRLLMVFLGCQLVSAQPQTLRSNAPSVRLMAATEIIRNPSGMNIPPHAVTDREFFLGTSGRLVIHIQDPHGNFGGQMHLAQILDSLMKQYELPLVLVEGSAHEVTLDEVRRIADERTWKIAAKRFLMDGIISGEEYLNLTTKHPMRIIGIEQRDLYARSLKVFSEIVERRAELLKYLNRAVSSVERIKGRIYPEAVRDYENRRNGHANIDKGILAQMRSLLSLAEAAKVDVLANYPETARLKSLIDREKDIDFKRVNLERGKLLEAVISKKGAGRIAQYAKDQARPGRTHETQALLIKRVLDAAGLSESEYGKYPELLCYKRFVDEFSLVRTGILKLEAAALEDEVYRMLLDTDQARKLRVVERYLGLLEKACRLQMSAEDYGLLVASRDDLPTVSWQAFLNDGLVRLGYPAEQIPYEPYFEEVRPFVDEFYGLVKMRDEVFLRNAKRVMDAGGWKAAFMIAGGYHSEHLKRLLRKEEISYVVLTPALDHSIDHQFYEKVLLASLPENAAGQAGSGADPGGPRDSGTAGTIRKPGLATEDILAAIQGLYGQAEVVSHLPMRGPGGFVPVLRRAAARMADGKAFADQESAGQMIDETSKGAGDDFDVDETAHYTPGEDSTFHMPNGELKNLKDLFGGRDAVVEVMKEEYPRLYAIYKKQQSLRDFIGNPELPENLMNFSVTTNRLVQVGKGAMGEIQKANPADRVYFKTISPSVVRKHRGKLENDYDGSELSRRCRDLNRTIMNEAELYLELQQEAPEFRGDVPVVLDVFINDDGTVTTKLETEGDVVALIDRDWAADEGLRDPRIRALSEVIDYADVIRRLHARGIVYRDIKPENALVSASGKVVAIDFGSAKHEKDTTTGIAGTPVYWTPEIKKAYETKRIIEVTPEMDVYSFGILLQVLFLKNLYAVTAPVPERSPFKEDKTTFKKLQALVSDMKATEAKDRRVITMEAAIGRLKQIRLELLSVIVLEDAKAAAEHAEDVAGEEESFLGLIEQAKTETGHFAWNGAPVFENDKKDNAAARLAETAGPASLCDRLQAGASFPGLAENARESMEYLQENPGMFAGLGGARLAGREVARTVEAQKGEAVVLLGVQAVADGSLEPYAIGRDGQKVFVPWRHDRPLKTARAALPQEAFPLIGFDSPDPAAAGLREPQILRQFRQAVFSNQKASLLIVREEASVSPAQRAVNDRFEATHPGGARLAMETIAAAEDIPAVIARYPGYRVGFGVTQEFFNRHSPLLTGHSIAVIDPEANTTKANMRIAFQLANPVQTLSEARRLQDQRSMLTRWLYGARLSARKLLAVIFFTDKAEDRAIALELIVKPAAGVLNIVMEAARMLEKAIPWSA